MCKQIISNAYYWSNWCIHKYLHWKYKMGIVCYLLTTFLRIIMRQNMHQILLLLQTKLELKSKISKKLKKKMKKLIQTWWKYRKKLDGIEMKYGVWTKQKHRLAIYSRFFKACFSKLFAFTGDCNFNGVFSWKAHATFK